MFSVCHGGTWANPLHFSVYDVNEIGSTSKWVNQQHLILYVINEIGNTLHPCGSLTMATWNQSGAMEAWWAHKPQVPVSKPGSDINRCRVATRVRACRRAGPRGSWTKE